MCLYCMTGDHFFRHDPPWPNRDPYPYNPLIPAPINPLTPINPWPLERLREFEDLLKRIKALEDQLGCPCEPNKADYIELFRQRIEALEKKAAEKPPLTSGERE